MHLEKVLTQINLSIFAKIRLPQRLTAILLRGRTTGFNPLILLRSL